MKAPRIMLAAGRSGSGKTMITCGLLRALQQMGKQPAAFKCGPDYIDPMFHEQVIGAPSCNLDPFFTEEETTQYLFCKHAAGHDISVLEGVMGYYDGLGGISTKGSAYDLAGMTKTPVLLVVDAKGMSVSALAFIKGYLQYKEDSRIAGVIFNRMSEMLYREIAPMAEKELGISCVGFVPELKECHLESRHLGLVMPDEVENLQEQVNLLAETLQKTLDFEKILAIAEGAEELSENQTMRTKIRDNIRQGMPVLAECGGYMYLSESMEDMDGNVYPMVQAVPGNVYRTKKLGRFGYITLTPNTKDTFRNGGNPVRGHEFHYFDSTDCGSAWHAAKPLRKRNWECIHATKRMMAGFPHLYYMASPHLALEFLEQCVSYRKEQEKTR